MRKNNRKTKDKTNQMAMQAQPAWVCDILEQARTNKDLDKTKFSTNYSLVLEVIKGCWFNVVIWLW